MQIVFGIFPARRQLFFVFYETLKTLDVTPKLLCWCSCPFRKINCLDRHWFCHMVNSVWRYRYGNLRKSQSCKHLKIIGFFLWHIQSGYEQDSIVPVLLLLPFRAKRSLISRKTTTGFQGMSGNNPLTSLSMRKTTVHSRENLISRNVFSYKHIIRSKWGSKNVTFGKYNISYLL